MQLFKIITRVYHIKCQRRGNCTNLLSFHLDTLLYIYVTFPLIFSYLLWNSVFFSFYRIHNYVLFQITFFLPACWSGRMLFPHMLTWLIFRNEGISCLGSLLKLTTSYDMCVFLYLYLTCLRQRDIITNLNHISRNSDSEILKVNE